MIKKLLLPVLTISLLCNQAAKPVDNNDPRLIGLVAVAVGATVSGGWLVKKGVEQMFGAETSDLSTTRSICKRVLGLPVAAVGVGLCIAGVFEIINAKDDIN
jgi:hypothetical protein